MDDQELVKRVLQGDELAIEQLHKRYAQPLFHYIHMQTNSFHDSEEILQDVFYKAATQLHQFKQRSSFKTWIYTITRNRLIDYYRSNKAQKNQVELSPLSADLHATPSSPYKLDDLQEALEQLPTNYQTVLHLRFIEGFSLLETAKIMGKSLYAVKNLQKRAQKQLKSDAHVEGFTYAKKG
ncbi:RNA polymerase, sigma-24 subunit, ECF subfamily [Bacillus sp. JCM 19046]|uniref:RNA polymerase sigma-70 factor (ECF subfamily) n=1 Tax=Shouchella xiaoxiensis TaxID=766895 RepID=A0ABS2SW28_9BACI|nr:RNA polymerase sigma factor [Shouchella xiaoxiensis]MBM7839748.1 RNA polymerase sigma-70 factor (ECF subfamily) [Shouchella xiaoxiensis]GAF11573.1 RNA polymerase, sigma-24 subunit, ECF subfamily [Bacillus sp. JCM 19045]GAF17389.1 RNA polymerase, sigma-24 subunit, ECF subfamily [Bacillus sp. JCM 19046]